MTPPPLLGRTAKVLDYNGRTWNPTEFAVCVGMDAMRLCMGLKTSNFTKREVIAWIEAMHSTQPKRSGQ